MYIKMNYLTIFKWHWIRHGIKKTTKIQCDIFVYNKQPNLEQMLDDTQGFWVGRKTDGAEECIK